MATESAILIARRFLFSAMVLLGLSGFLVLAALFLPIGGLSSEGVSTRSPLESLPRGKEDLDPLIRMMAGRRLIRPAQLQAAVKDSGAAQKFLRQLTLQGVVQLGGAYVAYVQVEKQGTKTLRKGDSVLGLTVEGIQPGRVTLSLEGVMVELSQ